MPLKMHKITFFPEKNKFKTKYVCLHYLKFSDPLPEIHLFFIWPKKGRLLQLLEGIARVYVFSAKHQDIQNQSYP